tara:strand:+ start:492 stop:905 length:414 start_codon:yes stop_codon:yes gene_type:complete
MKDFVLEQDKVTAKDYSDFYTSEVIMSMKFEKCVNYANFLNQPLTLGMFVPCDLEGNVLKEPQKLDQSDPYVEAVHANQNLKEWQQYQQAKERVLFEGVNKYFIEDICDGSRVLKGKVDSLSNNITLTTTAIKQIGL